MLTLSNIQTMFIKSILLSSVQVIYYGQSVSYT